MKARIDATVLERTVEVLAQRVEQLLKNASSTPEQRILIALAGVPGSGKSTVSAALIKTLEQRAIENVALIPMVN